MRSFLRVLPAALFVCIALTPPLAEAKAGGRIMGKVTNQAGDGLLGAVVTLFKQNVEGGTISFTRSDRSGSYVLANLMPGSYYLQVTRPGFAPLTSSNVKIDSGRTTSLDVILQEFIGMISDDSDPRNWDVKSVMRSTSDRRLIFRDLPNVQAAVDEARFDRSGTINVASATALTGQNYTTYPSRGQNGIVSNFAFTEPVSPHGRMIFSGQLNSGYESIWRVRNTYNYRPSVDRDLRFTVGYGRLNLVGRSLASVDRPDQFFSQDPALRESGIQTVAFGFESGNRFWDLLSVDYGVDVSKVYYGQTKSYISPFFQVSITPTENWTFKTAVSSKRLSDFNSVVLPDGETLSLTEPTLVTNSNGEVRVSQIKHSEVAVGRDLRDETHIEMAVYEDHTSGPGTPFVVTGSGGSVTAERLLQLRENQSSQHGLRVAVNRRILDFLSGSIAYVYGTGTAVSANGEAVSSDVLARDLLNYMQRSYYHSVTSQINANIPRTRTNLTTIVRWYPGSPITPIDLFGDRMDVMSKGVNFMIRQAIPLPEFMGNNGRWEAMIDLRNMFDQGIDHIRTSDGDIILTRNPRSLRFGINLNFY